MCAGLFSTVCGEGRALGVGGRRPDTEVLRWDVTPRCLGQSSGGRQAGVGDALMVKDRPGGEGLLSTPRAYHILSGESWVLLQAQLPHLQSKITGGGKWQIRRRV